MKPSAEQKELERRRLVAGRWLLKGVYQAEVARRVGVTQTSVTRWAEKLERGGLEALKSQRRRGRTAALDEVHRKRLAAALKAGALVQGFATELWTLPRIGVLIQRLFRHRYSDSQVSRILKAMGWSCQRPTGRAVQRNEAAIRRWKRQRWPALKKTP